MATVQQKLGEKIRRLRKGQGLSQESLAALVKMDLTSINEIENGKRNPSLKTIGKVARALKVSSKELLP